MLVRNRNTPGNEMVPTPSRVGAGRLLYIVSDCGFFLSHRLPLALAAKDAGYTVAVACPDDPSVARLRRSAIEHIPIAIRRRGSTPASEVRAIYTIWRALRSFGPDAVHLVTAKPIIYGGLLARMRGLPVIAAVTGLGYVFIHKSLAMSLVRRMVICGYRLALDHRLSHVIFQNGADLEVFREAGLLSRNTHSKIAGSGVDLERIRPEPLPDGATVVVMPSRLLRDKGVVEFVEAARILKGRGQRAVFRLLGDPDENNPTSVSRAELDRWVSSGVVEWHPYTPDINGALARTHIVVLPSYREGFPKTLIDAAAAGRAAAASDVPGCRDAIVDGVTGLLFAVRDSADTARVLDRLIKDRGLQERLGRAARTHAEANFDVRRVCQTHLEIYANAVALR